MKTTINSKNNSPLEIIGKKIELKPKQKVFSTEERGLAYDAILSHRDQLINLTEDKSMWGLILLKQDVFSVAALLKKCNEEKMPITSKNLGTIVEKGIKETKEKYEKNSRITKTLQQLNKETVSQTKLIGGGTVGRLSADVDMDLVFFDKVGEIAKLSEQLKINKSYNDKDKVSLKTIIEDKSLNVPSIIKNIYDKLKECDSQCEPLLNTKLARKGKFMIQAKREGEIDVDLLIDTRSKEINVGEIVTKTGADLFVGIESRHDELSNKIRDPRSKDFHDFITLASDNSTTPKEFVQIIKEQQQLIADKKKVVSVKPELTLLEKLEIYRDRIKGFTSVNSNDSTRTVLNNTSYSYSGGGAFQYKIDNSKRADEVYGKLNKAIELIIQEKEEDIVLTKKYPDNHEGKTGNKYTKFINKDFSNNPEESNEATKKSVKYTKFIPSFIDTPSSDIINPTGCGVTKNPNEKGK